MHKSLKAIKKYWIIVFISALLLAGFVSTLLTSYFVAYRSLSQEIRQYSLPLTSINVYSEIQKDLLRSIHISSQMAEDTFVKDWLLDGELDPAPMVRYLAAIQNKYQTVTAFFVSEKTRKYYHPNGVLKVVSQNDPGDAWYFRARAMEKPYEINIDNDTADRSRITIFINYQVRGYDGSLVGLTGVGLELKQVQTILANYKERFLSEVFFVDREGKVVISSRDYSLPENLKEWEFPSFRFAGILSGSEASFEHTLKGHSYFVTSRYIPEFDLTMMVVRDSDPLQEQLTSRVSLNLLIGIFITLVVVVVVVVILRRYHQSLERMASIDTLTGIYNRTAFSILFSQAVNELKRKPSPLSLALLDIDNFKQVNDRLGHHGGDLLLKQFVDVMSRTVRVSDELCRWGGEEFVILLKDCRLNEAVKTVERIKDTLSQSAFEINGEEVRLTFSAGVTKYRQGESLSQLAMRADRLMYEAKNQGKNRIVAL